MGLAMFIKGESPAAADSSGKLPERNYSEERLRHAARLVKAVHEHDVEGAEDAMRAHHAVCADEDEAMEE